MTDLTDLIARLEAATEGSADLDGATHNAICGEDEQAEWITPSQHLGRWGYRQNGRWRTVPLYSRSLDAALSLVPEGMSGLMAFGPKGAVANLMARQLGEVAEQEWHPPGRAPALALCIAALKARAAR